MDLEQAVKKHVEWKTTFRSAMDNKEKLDSVAISKDNCCELGKWLYGGAKKSCPAAGEFETVVEKHAVFHTAAGAVAKLINAGRYTEAQTAIEPQSAFVHASTDVVMALRNLRLALSRSPA